MASPNIVYLESVYCAKPLDPQVAPAITKSDTTCLRKVSRVWIALIPLTIILPLPSIPFLIYMLIFGYRLGHKIIKTMVSLVPPIQPCYNPDMKLVDLGEFNLIDQLAGIVQKSGRPSALSWQNLVIGIGDDAAVWQNESSRTLATTDCLIEGVHFTKETTSWHDLGWKALAVNLSDVAAMGGRPLYALVTIGLPSELQADDVLELYAGMTELAEKSETAIVGGDVSTAPAVFINIAVIGGTGKHLLTRSAARPGEVVAVTGYLGSAAGGLRLLQEHCKPDNISKTLCEAFLRPTPRLEIGALLTAEGVRCAIDVSDGLAADLGHICRQSGVGAVVETSRLPIHPALTALFGAEALTLALSGGEDYELLFTAPANTIERVAAKALCPVTIIGTVTSQNPGEIRLTDPNGKTLSLDHGGWQHFAH